MNRTAVKIVGMCLLATVLAVGCATAAKGPTDEQQIQSALTQWGDLLKAKDVDKVMALYSDNYKSEQGDKAAVAGFLKDREDYLEGSKMDATATKIVVTGDKATAAPVNLSGAGFNVDLSLDFAKEGGKWLIIGMTGS